MKPNIYVYILVMAGVTYLIRMLPLVLFKKEITSPFVKSFLYYVPYACLAAMTFPAILTATAGGILSGVVGLVVALIVAYKEKSLLTGVVERTAIERIDGDIQFVDENGKKVVLEENTPVSMNMWGFTPDYFEYSEEFFKEFLKANMGNLKSEYFIPLMVNKLITEGTARVKVLDTTSKWFGVTYAADRQGVEWKTTAV